MVISHLHRFIFIKTVKTAGTSIEVFLSQYCGNEDILTPIFPPVEQHVPRNYQGRFNPVPGILAGRPKSTIRDFLSKTRFNSHMPATQVRMRIPRRLWNSYFKFCVERNPWNKTLSQYHMVNHRRGGDLSLNKYFSMGDFPINYPRYTDKKGRIIVDRILKYEDLDRQLSEVFELLNIPFSGSLGIRAKSEYREDRRPYWEVLSVEQRASIERIFIREINLHGYSF